MSTLRNLAEPFPAKFIHPNPSGGGSYVSHPIVEQRLIAVLGMPPDFQLVELIRGDVAAIEPNPNGKSTRAKAGAPALTNVVVGAICRMTAFIDHAVAKVEEAGDCEDPHNWPHDGARAKDAMSDAYKRCAMRLGEGLHLWCKSDQEYFLFDYLSKQEAGAMPARSPDGPAETPDSVEPSVNVETGAGTSPAHSDRPVPEVRQGAEVLSPPASTNVGEEGGSGSIAAEAEPVAPSSPDCIEGVDDPPRELTDVTIYSVGPVTDPLPTLIGTEPKSTLAQCDHVWVPAPRKGFELCEKCKAGRVAPKPDPLAVKP